MPKLHNHQVVFPFGCYGHFHATLKIQKEYTIKDLFVSQYLFAKSSKRQPNPPPPSPPLIYFANMQRFVQLILINFVTCIFSILIVPIVHLWLLKDVNI